MIVLVLLPYHCSIEWVGKMRVAQIFSRYFAQNTSFLMHLGYMKAHHSFDDHSNEMDISGSPNEMRMK